MPEDIDLLAERVRAVEPGLTSLLAEVMTARAGQPVVPEAGVDAALSWNAFEDAFPTFYQFTNRPR
jgi:hypothetical protein